jgi:tetratricopeptide (TPR) repeat protein
MRAKSVFIPTFMQNSGTLGRASYLYVKFNALSTPWFGLPSFALFASGLGILGLLLFGTGSSGCTSKPDGVEAVVDSAAELLRLNAQIEAQPQNPDAWFARSRYFARNQLFDKASNDANQALTIDSLRADIWLHLADLSFTTKKVEDAAMQIEKALAIEPEGADANLRMAELQYYLGKYPETFKHLDVVIRQNPYQPRAYFTKGMAFKEMGDTGLAISSFQTATEQDPAYFHAWIQLGQLHAAKRSDLAILYFKNAIDVNPSKQESYYALAYYYQQTGRVTEAMSTYLQLLELDPQHVPSMHNLGFLLLFEKNQADEALVWFDKALNLDPEFIQAQYHRGYCLEFLGQKSEARQAYQAALALDPQMALAQQGLSRVQGK